MLKLAGYADRLSARPGETINFKLSNATDHPVEAEFIRVISADPNPAGPGLRERPLDAAPGPLSVDEHPLPRGSYGWASAGAAFSALADFTVSLSLQPTKLPHQTATVLCWSDHGGATEFELRLEHDGALAVTYGNGTLTSTKSLDRGQWYDVWVTFEAATALLSLNIRRSGAGESHCDIQHNVASTRRASQTRLWLATPPRSVPSDQPTFNGRIENPRIDRACLSSFPKTHDANAETVILAWDFSKEISTSRIYDVGPNAIHGELVNHPARAMRASNWSGREMCWRHAPGEYAAIHFHEDDLTDCQWPTALAWQIPNDLPSGCYALKLRAGAETENIPFFVVPPVGKPASDIAVLVSTITYTIYGNHARPEWQRDPSWQDDWRNQTRDWQGYEHNPGDHVEYGLSTYNNHTDGSGISIASWHRPMLNLRHGYVTYPGPGIRGSGLRHYPADTHLHTFLEDQGYAFDIITDWELHNEGLKRLKDYRVVMTGTHPEYHTREMLDALKGYRDQGGRLMYLGGNGFYWKVALDPERDGVIEIRRAEGGIRAWAAEPGEYYNQFDGEYGGLWRRNARPPQHLVGVGFSAQGNFVGSHYVVNGDVRNSRAAWILEGITSDTIGGHGLSGHGAAGFELDRADKSLGTPKHAVVIAASEGHEPEAPWVLVPEERLTHLTTIPGETDGELIRSDIVFFETEGGGAVFSVGSITFCGSLLTNGGDNDIAQLVCNVLDRFRDPETNFAVPE